MKKLSFIMACIAGLVFMGCRSGSADKICGEWETGSFVFNGTEQEICISDMQIKATGAETVEVNGNSGVNTFFGSATVKENSFKMGGNAGSTKMAGEPKAMEYEDNFLSTLMNADSFEVVEENGKTSLRIINTENNSKIVFAKK